MARAAFYSGFGARANRGPPSPLPPHASPKPHRLERGVHSELRHEALQVGADRVRGQLQLVRDLFPADALNEEKQDIPLTPCQRCEQVIAVDAAVLILDEQVQHRAKLPQGQPRLAADSAADDAEQTI